MARWFLARTIVEEHSVSTAVGQLSGAYPRFDKAYEALKWVLARACDKVDCLSQEFRGVDYRLYRQAGDVLAGTPDIVVLYTYSDDEVNILDIKAEKPALDDE